LAVIERRITRTVRAGTTVIGGDAEIVVQSMCATRTQDLDATAAQAQALHAAGAGIVRIAIDNDADADCLIEISKRTDAVLSVDLQENYRLAARVAPHVQKLRYNPGHLHHHERDKSTAEKVKFIAGVAAEHDCALRVGVNCGSVAPDYLEREPDQMSAMVASAVDHCALLDGLGFTNFVVSLKDSDPAKVIEANTRFAAERPDVPLHLGVTEAGMPPEGIIKTRIAFEQLLSKGVGETLRVSLTVPNPEKPQEIEVGRAIIDDVRAGRFRSVPDLSGLNIISCPSCSRVENEAFVELAQDVREMTRFAKEHDITIAVMGCRVNGPGETDDADLGLWCGPKTVNLKRGGANAGTYPYGEILGALRAELDALIVSQSS
jgi:(E)-4-hydroxy-3-methylbut-2-enyl-diphosphate synthase